VWDANVAMQTGPQKEISNQRAGQHQRTWTVTVLIHLCGRHLTMKVTGLSGMLFSNI